MYFSSNIKLLRKRRGRTQDEVALALGMKRSTLSGYENQVAEPGLEALMTLAGYFNIAIDTMVKLDLSRLSDYQLGQIERGNDVFITGSKLRVLTTTIDGSNNENIELVEEKAKAGYANGFADPEYIRVLPAFHLPFLSRNKKYRTFQISGDSMLPIPDKSYVTGEYVVDWSFIRSFQPYIILTREEGVVFKMAENKIADQGLLTLHSLNPLYEPYDLSVNDIREVWRFVHYISSEIPEPNREKDQLAETVKQLQKQVKAIQIKLEL